MFGDARTAIGHGDDRVTVFFVPGNGDRALGLWRKGFQHIQRVGKQIEQHVGELILQSVQRRNAIEIGFHANAGNPHVFIDQPQHSGQGIADLKQPGLTARLGKITEVVDGVRHFLDQGMRSLERRPGVFRVLPGILQVDQDQAQGIERLPPLVRDIADHFAHCRHPRLIANQGFFPAVFFQFVRKQAFQFKIDLFKLHRQVIRFVGITTLTDFCRHLPDNFAEALFTAADGLGFENVAGHIGDHAHGQGGVGTRIPDFGQHHLAVEEILVVWRKRATQVFLVHRVAGDAPFFQGLQLLIVDMPRLRRDQILDIHCAELFGAVVGHPAPGLVYMADTPVVIGNSDAQYGTTENRFVARIAQHQLMLGGLAYLNFIAQQGVAPLQIGQEKQGERDKHAHRNDLDVPLRFLQTADTHLVVVENHGVDIRLPLDDAEFLHDDGHFCPARRIDIADLDNGVMRQLKNLFGLKAIKGDQFLQIRPRFLLMHHGSDLVGHFFRVIECVVPATNAGITESLDQIRIFAGQRFGSKQRIAVKIDPVIDRSGHAQTDALLGGHVGDLPEIFGNHVERTAGQILKGEIPDDVGKPPGIRRNAFA